MPAARADSRCKLREEMPRAERKGAKGADVSWPNTQPFQGRYAAPVPSEPAAYRPITVNAGLSASRRRHAINLLVTTTVYRAWGKSGVGCMSGGTTAND